MTSSLVAAAEAPVSGESLEQLCARIVAVNPFTDNRSGGVSAQDCDVPTIHALPFERLITLAQEAHQQRRGLGAMLWGEAGIGKSHLLTRFARWAEQDKHACLVYVHNLQARPENLPRSLLKAVLSMLMQGRIDQFHATLLYRLANAFMREALQYDLQFDPNRTYSWQELDSAYGKLLDQLSAEEPWRAALVDRTIYDVVWSFFRSAYLAREGVEDGNVARWAVRWLAGDAFDAGEARRLGLPPSRSADEPVALADDQMIKQVLVTLCRLAASRRQPFVLCFDQVDNLDIDQAAALARFLAALLDCSTNLLVVVSGIQATLLQWRTHKVIQDSAWDRLAQFEIALQRICVTDGCSIVADRLQRFLEPDTQLEAVQQRLQEDYLFPLGKAWADEFLDNKVEVRPRDMLSWAREGWRRQQALLRELGGPNWLARWGSSRPAGPAVRTWTAAEDQAAVDAKVAQKLAECKAQREAQPHTLPPNAANLAGLIAALVEQWRPSDRSGNRLQVEQPAESSRGRRPAYDLVVSQSGVSNDAEALCGICFLATGSALSVTGALRRLVRDPNSPRQVLLITEERTALPLGKAGNEYYEELCQRGERRFRHLELTFAQYAELDALQGVVGLGRAGDLEIELPGGQTRAVGADEVIASHQRQGRYAAAPILKALRSLSSEESPPEAVLSSVDL
jgi:hypothetical protein